MSEFNKREAVLKAAEHIVTHEGVQHLTIARVAEEAGLSRGGVFYHFPTKEALIEGMVQRLVMLFDQALTEMMAQDPEPYGRLTRAYARLVLLLQPQPRPARLWVD